MRKLHLFMVMLLWISALNGRTSSAQDNPVFYQENLNTQMTRFWHDRADRQLFFMQDNYVSLSCEQESCVTPFDVALDTLGEYLLDLQTARLSPKTPLLKKILQLKIASGKDLAIELQLFSLLKDFKLYFADSTWENTLLEKVTVQIEQGTISDKAIITIFADKKHFQSQKWQSLREVLYELYKDQIPEILVTKDLTARSGMESAKILLHTEPRIQDYKSGKYLNHPRLYMLCRQDRAYPCLMVMKDRHNTFHKTTTGQIWMHPALGYSRHKKAYNQRNGNTPSGIHRIDSVMPEANSKMVFGKYRRLILNFVAKTAGDADTQLLLPNALTQETWWQEASVARDIGRSALRIHGTGLRSSSSAKHYPLVATSGCVAQRENKYGKVNFMDQRLLLNEMMRAQNIESKFENEVQIRGLLYIINIDNQKAPVTSADLKTLGVPI